MSKTLLDICVMKEAINVRQCKRARACQLSKNQGIKVGNQMEEKSGKIKYLPRTRTRAKEGGGDYNDPTYGTASRVKSGGRLDFAHDHRYP